MALKYVLWNNIVMSYYNIISIATWKSVSLLLYYTKRVIVKILKFSSWKVIYKFEKHKIHNNLSSSYTSFNIDLLVKLN